MGSYGIEEINAQRSANYDNLFEMGDRVEKMGMQDIEAIVQEIANKSYSLHLGRKWASVDARLITQDEQSSTTDAKAKAMCKTSSLIIDCFSVAFNMASAFTGGPNAAYGAGLSAIAQGFNSTSQYKSKANDSVVDGLNHHYQTLGNFISDDTHRIQGADKDYDQALQMANKVSEESQKMFNMVASN